MAIIKTEGIVISETNYSESSKIIKIFTKDYGIISAISKGCRNVKSKIRGISNQFSYANYDISYKETGLSTIIDGSTINTLRNIITDIDNITYLTYILDLTEQVYKHSSSKEIYPLLVSLINKLNDKYDPLVLTYIYEIKLLNYLGIKPNVDSCTICGNTKNILTISISDGGYICSSCYKNGKIYSSNVIKLIRMFTYIDIDSISKISIKEETKQELETFITEYYDSLSGIYLKSKDFIKNLRKLDNKKGSK